jgi:histidinol dehydrogenase
LKILDINDREFSRGFDEILGRGAIDIEGVTDVVRKIINRVKNSGDEAIFEDIERFDNWRADKSSLKIDPSEMESAYEKLDKNLKEALITAYKRIESYHKKGLPSSWMEFEENGSALGVKVSAVDRAGLYIPGGKAAYPSSLLMNAVAAKVAGVKEIVVTTPTPNREINSLLLAAMHLCSIKEAYRVGGATAIAALAYGSESIKKCEVITGPGNIYVATAKKLVFGDVNIDMIAGPSEIGVIADESANIKYLSYDLLSQAEHDEMASSLLITTSKEVASGVKSEIERILPTLSRSEIATKSILNRGAIITVNSLDEAIELMNEIAPEHLELMVKNPFNLLPKIKHAGAIFLGENTPEAIGDYIAGPNHTLPTGGSAKFFSPLSSEVFLKRSSIISFSKEAILDIGSRCALLAESEGLEAHKLSVEVRLENGEKE